MAELTRARFHATLISVMASFRGVPILETCTLTSCVLGPAAPRIHSCVGGAVRRLLNDAVRATICRERDESTYTAGVVR